MRWLLLLVVSACSSGDIIADTVEDLIPRYGHLGDQCGSVDHCWGLSSDLSDAGFGDINADCAKLVAKDGSVTTPCGFVCSGYRHKAACNSVGGSCQVVRSDTLWCKVR